MLSDYVLQNPEELSFWRDKVRAAAAADGDIHAVAMQLSDEIWYYYEERSAVVSPFREMAAREGLRRTSMRNLAEYWLRLWVEPKPKRQRSV